MAAESVKKTVPKEWFPTLPGLHPLAKADVLDDLEYIQNNTPAEAKLAAAAAADKHRAAALKRKGGKDARGETGSKRSRLNDKIGQEKKSLGQIKTRHTALRRELEGYRAEITQYRDAIATTEREIQNAVRERKALEEHYNALREDYTHSVHSGEQNRLDYERSIRELGARLARESAAAGDAHGQLRDLQRLEAEMKERDRGIDEAKQQLATKELHLKALTDLTASAVALGLAQPLSAAASGAAPAAGAGAGAAAGGAASTAELTAMCEKAGLAAPPPGATVEWLRAYIERVQTAEKAGRDARAKAEDADGQRTELKKTVDALTEEVQKNQKIIQELMATDKLNSQLLAEERDAQARLTSETDRLTKLKLEHEQLFHKQEDKFIAQNEILAVADKRAIEAELTLREVVTEIAVLRNGNRVLQNSYNQLLEKVRGLDDEHGAVVDELADAKDQQQLTKQQLLAFRTRISRMAAENDHLKLVLQYNTDASNNDKNQIKRMAHELDSLTRCLMEMQSAAVGVGVTEQQHAAIAAAAAAAAAAQPVAAMQAAAPAAAAVSSSSSSSAAAPSAAAPAAASASSASAQSNGVAGASALPPSTAPPTAAAAAAATTATGTAAAGAGGDVVEVHKKHVQSLYESHAAAAAAAAALQPAAAAAAADGDGDVAMR